MKRHQALILVGVVLVAGTGAFCVGRTEGVRQRTDAASARAEWLKNLGPETAQAEQDFERQTHRLLDEIHAKQATLASMLPDNRFTAAQILGQVDDIAQSYTTLAGSVAGHVAQLRRVLPEVRKQAVMQACADSLRGALQRRYRWRGGAQDQGQGFMGGRRGGWGRGPGQGAGYGRQYRGGRNENTQGLSGRLRLTPQQSAWIQQQDPNFESQCAALQNRLSEAYTSLAAGLENMQMTDQQLTMKVNTLIEARNALEKRVAQYIVLLRPQLSQEQRGQLGRLSSRADAA